MSTAAFLVIAFMLTAYVVLDGYDLGVGIVAPAIGRTESERAAAMKSIGPFWNGNEVWLIAAGAALFALFPAAYAAAFSGFYLPFIIMLWLLMFRGIALELRGHFPSPLWRQFWDAAFFASSALLVAVFGLALGNLLRGLPLDGNGSFRGTLAYLLNPYALLVAFFAIATLAQHGAAFAAMRIDGTPGIRAASLAGRLFWPLVALYAVTSAATFAVRTVPPSIAATILPALSAASLAALFVFRRRGNAAAAFAASSAFIVFLLAAAAATLYPYLLPGFPAGRAGGVSIFDAAPSAAALTCALAVTIAGSAGVLIYASLVWRRMGSTVRVE